MPRESADLSPTPDDQPMKGPRLSLDERVEKFLADHQLKYSEAIHAAREAATATAAPAWQENYAEQRKAHAKLQQMYADSLSRCAKQVADYDTDEDTEKELIGTTKLLKDERIRYQAWKSRAVNPMSDKPQRCTELRETVLREARRIEQEQPLISRGFGASVAKLVDRWPTAKWDSEHGVVSVVEPPPMPPVNLNA